MLRKLYTAHDQKCAWNQYDFFFFKVAMTNRFVIFVLRALQYHVVVVDHLGKKAHCLLSNDISTLLESQGNADLFLRVLKKNWTHKNGKQNKYNRLAQAPIPPFFARLSSHSSSSILSLPRLTLSNFYLQYQHVVMHIGWRRKQKINE